MSLDPNQPGDEQLDIVRGLKGVRYAFYLDREILGILREEEAKVRSSANIPVDNEGFTEALKRECVICIVKSQFRPPPEPTVILRSGDGKTIGEEVFPWTKDKHLGRTDIVWLFDSFVLFPPGRSERRGVLRHASCVVPGTQREQRMQERDLMQSRINM